MYERFTDRSRKVMQLANQEAQRFNHEYIGTEHILLGLIKEGSGVAANVLKNLDIDLKKIRQEIEKIVQSGPDMVALARLPQTPRAKKVIEFAVEEARLLNHNYVGTEHLLLGLVREQEGVASQVLMNLGLKLEDVREEVLNLLGHNPESSEGKVWPTRQGQRKTPALDTFGRDLTALARERKLFPLIGRTSELERLLLILGCHTDRSAVLVGPPGVGKSALVHGLAQLIAKAEPSTLATAARIVQLSLASMVVELKDDSEQLMERIQAAALEASRGDVVLFVSDLFAFGYDSRLVKAVLDTSQAQWIATATPQTLHLCREDDLLRRNWQPVFLNPLSIEEAIAVLRALRPSYRDRDQLEIRDDALAAAVELSERFFPEESLPGKAIRVLEQSISLLRLRRPAPPHAADNIASRLEQSQCAMEEAIAAADFERAAHLRDQRDKLRRERMQLLKDWQSSAANRVLDAQLVQQIVTKLTGTQFADSDAIREKPR